MDDLRALHYFVAAYEEGNLTAAARRCFISQPSVSATLAAMERDLDVRLFVRHKKGVTPTSAAEILYPRAKQLLVDAAGVRALFKAESAEENVTLGLLRSLDTTRTARLVAPIAAMPGVRLKLVDADDPADARVIEKCMATEAETFTPLWRERFVLALSSRHPLAIAAPIGDAELRSLPFIARCHCEVGMTKMRGPPLRIVAVAESEEWALALVAAGIGVTILPEGSVGIRKDVVVRPLASHKVTRVIGIAHSGRRSLSRRSHEVITKLKASTLSR